MPLVRIIRNKREAEFFGTSYRDGGNLRQPVFLRSVMRGAVPRRVVGNGFSTKFLGKAGRKAIFLPKDISHGSGCNQQSLAHRRYCRRIGAEKVRFGDVGKRVFQETGAYQKIYVHGE